MAHRPHPKYASNNSANGPWCTCDRCGFIWSQNRMAFDMQFMGGSVMQSTGFLVCPRCADLANFQQALIILPPDPPPVMNTRVEPYAVDETSWLTTESEAILDTETDESLITSIPNPAQNANTAMLTASLSYPAGSVAVAYLDLFDGDPTGTGTSVLAAITGSATRTNIADDLEVNGHDVALNPEAFVVSSASESLTNVSYVGIYSAASGGTLLTSGTVSATTPNIGEGTAVQFDALAIAIDLS